MFSRIAITCFLLVGLATASTAFAKESVLLIVETIDHLDPSRLPVIAPVSSDISPSQPSLVPTARLKQEEGSLRIQIAQPSPAAPLPDSEPRLGVVTVQEGTIGQRIISVTPNSPAMRIRFSNGQASYLEPNDVILSINGVPAANRDAYLVELADAPVGTLQFTIRNSRNGNTYACTTTISDGSGSSANRIGVTVSDVTGGVEVVTVSPNSPATSIVLSDGSRATLSTSDLFLTVNGRAVTTASDFNQAVSNSPTAMQFTFRRFADQRVLTATAQLTGGSGGIATGVRFGAYVTSNPGGGVKVTSVMQHTPARRVNLNGNGPLTLESGDVITHVNGVNIIDEQHFRQEVKSSPKHMHFNVTNVRDGVSYNGDVHLRY